MTRSSLLHTSRRRAAIAIVGATLFLGACSGDWTRRSACDGNNFGQVTLQPGCSALCTDEPCAVYLIMPPGERTYRVTSPGIPIGDYPAGETVFLGSFWAGRYVFTVEGSGAPPAHLAVTSSSAGGN